MRVKVLHLEPRRYPEPLRQRLATAADVTYAECADQAALLRAAGAADYQALFTRLGLAIDQAVLGRLPALRWLVTPTTGLDHLDLRALEARGVRVISLRGERALLEQVPSTAEHTWALLLALLRRIPAAHRDVLAGSWRREPFLGEELQGKTLGLVGCGRLGRMVARYGLAFGMRVMAHDLLPEAIASAPQPVAAVGVAQLLAESDVVSLHLPLNDQTEGYLDRARIGSIKQGAVLINTARGELVDEDALAAALASGQLAGAALDVLRGDGRWDEATVGDSPLLRHARTHDNVVLTPHLGGYARQSILRTREFVVEQLLAALDTAAAG